MDRFKFRAYITVSYEDDDDNEKEVSFYLYNVYMSDEGDFIYVDIESLRDALNNLLSADEIDRIEEILQANSYTGDYENICIERGFYKNPEQSTGLKDKNGKLIYEGDIVEFYSYSFIDAISGESMKRRVGVVVWNDEMLKFDVVVNGKAIPDLCKKTDDNQFVIIGNIHENKDLLENK